MKPYTLGAMELATPVKPAWKLAAEILTQVERNVVSTTGITVKLLSSTL